MDKPQPPMSSTTAPSASSPTENPSTADRDPHRRAWDDGFRIGHDAAARELAADRQAVERERDAANDARDKYDRKRLLDAFDRNHALDAYDLRRARELGLLELPTEVSAAPAPAKAPCGCQDRAAAPVELAAPCGCHDHPLRELGTAVSIALGAGLAAGFYLDYAPHSSAEGLLAATTAGALAGFASEAETTAGKLFGVIGALGFAGACLRFTVRAGAGRGGPAGAAS